MLEYLGISDYDIILSKESHEPIAWKSEISQKIANERDLEFVVGNAVITGKSKVNFWTRFVDKAFSIKHLPILDSFSTWHLTRFINSEESEEKIWIIDSKHLLSSSDANNESYIIHTYDGEWLDHSLDRPWEI